MSSSEQTEKAVRQKLDELGAEYEWMEIDPEFADTAAFCERYDVPEVNSGNTIIVASRREPRQFCACLVQATVQLDVNRTVRKLMGVRRLSFASAEDTAALTGMMIGGVTPFGLPEDLALYIDEPLMALEWVIVGAGSRSAKVKLHPSVFERLPNVEVVPGLSRPRPA